MPSCGENTKIVRLKNSLWQLRAPHRTATQPLAPDHRELVNGCLVLTFVELG